MGGSNHANTSNRPNDSNRATDSEPRDLRASSWKTSELFGRESPGKFPRSLIPMENN